MKYFGHLGVDPAADPMRSGVTNLQKYQLHLDPSRYSTADDGLSDGWKVSHGFEANQTVSTVGDGIPDYWKAQYGFSVDDDIGNDDPDGDGLTNLEEFYAGTDPTNPD